MNILDKLRARQDSIAVSVSKGETSGGQYARNFAMVRKDMAIYADANAVGPPQVDERQMLSWWTISSTAQDREGDILDPKGCLPTIKNYSRNPVVLYDHGGMPVGTSMGDGMSPVLITDQGIRACCKHHDLTPLAFDVWNLTLAGVLRACSIGFLPLDAEQLGSPSKGSLNSPRYLFKSFDITEWSICSVGVNPEALRIELSAGRVKTDWLRKSLADKAQKPLIYAHGWEADMAVNFRDIQTVRLAKAQYPKKDDAAKWLKSMGLSDVVLVERPKSWEFVQKIAAAQPASVKLDKGIEAWLTKALPDDEEEKKKKSDEDPKDEADKSDDEPKDEDKSEEKPDEEKSDITDEDKTDVTDEDKAVDEENADNRDKADDDPLEQKTEDPNAEATGDEARTTLGAMTLADVMSHCRGFLEYLEGAAGLNDSPTVIASLADAENDTKTIMAKIEAQFAADYPALNLEQLIAEQSGEKNMNEGTGSDGGYLLEDDENTSKTAKSLGISTESLEEILAALKQREKSLSKAASWQDQVCERFKITV